MDMLLGSSVQSADDVKNVDMSSLRRIFTEKECTVERLTRDYDVRRSPRGPIHPFSEVLNLLQGELLELMQRSVQLWKHLSSVSLLIQSIKNDNPSLGPSTSLLNINTDCADYVTAWLGDSESANTGNERNGECAFEKRQPNIMDALDFGEMHTDTDEGDPSDVDSDSDEHITKEETDCVCECCKSYKDNMKLIQKRDCGNNVCRETSVWLKFACQIPSNLLSTRRFQSRISLTDIAKWREVPVIMDIGSVTRDLFSKSNLTSSIRQIVPRRRLHRQDCIYGSWDSLHSLSDKSRYMCGNLNPNNAQTKAPEKDSEVSIFEKSSYLNDIPRPEDTQADKRDSRHKAVVTNCTNDMEYGSSVPEFEISTNPYETCTEEVLDEDEANLDDTNSAKLSHEGHIQLPYVDRCHQLETDAISTEQTSAKTNCSETESGQESSKCNDTDEVFDITTEDAEVADVEFSFLVFRDGYVSCRIMTPTLEKSSKERHYENDWEYLTIADNKVYFTVFGEDIDTCEVFADDEEYHIDLLFAESDHSDENTDTNDQDTDTSTMCTSDMQYNKQNCFLTNVQDISSEIDSNSCLQTCHIDEDCNTRVLTYVEDIESNEHATLITESDYSNDDVLVDSKKSVCSQRISSMDSGFGDEMIDSFDKPD